TTPAVSATATARTRAAAIAGTKKPRRGRRAGGGAAITDQRSAPRRTRLGGPARAAPPRRSRFSWVLVIPPSPFLGLATPGSARSRGDSRELPRSPARVGPRRNAARARPVAGREARTERRGSSESRVRRPRRRDPGSGHVRAWRVGDRRVPR